MRKRKIKNRNDFINLFIIIKKIEEWELLLIKEEVLNNKVRMLPFIKMKIKQLKHQKIVNVTNTLHFIYYYLIKNEQKK